MTWQRVLGMPCNPQREIANVVASTVPSPPLPMRIFWETNKEGYYRTSTVSLDPCLSLATMAITQAEPSWTKNEETGNSFIPPTTNLLLSLHSSPNHFVGVWGGGVELQNTRERDLIITKNHGNFPRLSRDSKSLQLALWNLLVLRSPASLASRWNWHHDGKRYIDRATWKWTGKIDWKIVVQVVKRWYPSCS